MHPFLRNAFLSQNCADYTRFYSILHITKQVLSNFQKHIVQVMLILYFTVQSVQHSIAIITVNIILITINKNMKKPS